MISCGCGVLPVPPERIPFETQIPRGFFQGNMMSSGMFCPSGGE